MFSVGHSGSVALKSRNHAIGMRCCGVEKGLGLIFLDAVRVPMMTSFHKNGGSNLTKEWANIFDTVRFYELETKVGCNVFEKILDKSCPLIG